MKEKEVEQKGTKVTETPEQNLAKGVFYMLLSTFGFALMNLFSRLAGPLPATQKVFVRNLIIFFITFFIFLRDSQKYGREKLSPLNFRTLVVRSLVGVLGIIGNFYAVDHLPLSDATILGKLSPFFTIIFSYFLLKERVNKTQAVCLAIAFVGALIVVQPGFDNPQLLAYAVACGGGMFAGLAYTFVRILSMRGVGKNFIVMFFAGFTVLLMLPLMAIKFVPMTKEQWLYMSLVGVCGFFGQIGMTYAYAYAPARSISIFDYSQVIFSALLGMLVVDEFPDILSILGYIVIFSASFILFLSNYKAAKKYKSAASAEK